MNCLIATICGRNLDFCMKGLTLNDPNESIARNQVTNIIKFDREGVLVAVGSNSGSLTVFDFDEYQMMVTRGGISSDSDDRKWMPVIEMDLVRSISCIEWSPTHCDHIAVSFTHYSRICIFDLSASHHSPLVELEVGRNGVGPGGGHSSLLFLSKGIFGGSESGHLRQWSRPYNKTASKRCDWNLLADPISSGSNARPVVAICSEGFCSDRYIYFLPIVWSILLSE